MMFISIWNCSLVPTFMASEAGLGGLQNWFAAWKPADAAVRLRMFDGDFADTDLAEHGPEQAGERLPQAGRTDGRMDGWKDERSAHAGQHRGHRRERER